MSYCLNKSFTTRSNGRSVTNPGHHNFYVYKWFYIAMSFHINWICISNYLNIWLVSVQLSWVFVTSHNGRGGLPRTRGKIGYRDGGWRDWRLSFSYNMYITSFRLYSERVWTYNYKNNTFITQQNFFVIIFYVTDIKIK